MLLPIENPQFSFIQKKKKRKKKTFSSYQEKLSHGAIGLESVLKLHMQ